MNEVIVTTGNYKLIIEKRILFLNDKSANISFKIDDIYRMEIQFIFEKNDDEKSDIKWESYMKDESSPCYTFHLINLEKTLMQGLVNPISIGKKDGKDIVMTIFVTKVNDANPILDFAIYEEVIL